MGNRTEVVDTEGGVPQTDVYTQGPADDPVNQYTTRQRDLNPPAVARSIFDSNNLGRLKLFGAVLSRMELDDTGRLATVSVDEALAADCGGTYEDTEGLINLPLTVKAIQAVVFFKEIGPGDWRVSMRSKGNVDINAVAKVYGGGGHKNASGCSAEGRLEDIKRIFEQQITVQIDKAAADTE